MFTGIVEETGEIVAVDGADGGRRLRVAASFAGDLGEGQSISVSGACLTVEDAREGWFEVFLSRETLDRTYLDAIGEGDAVNLERALPADGRLDGHFVQGHVDAVVEIVAIREVGEDWEFEFAIPEGYGRYLVEKGSVALDGVSLTVADRFEDTFTVAVIPTTYRLTNLSGKAPGDPVHVEVDVVAKYVERLVSGADKG